MTRVLVAIGIVFWCLGCASQPYLCRKVDGG